MNTENTALQAQSERETVVVPPAVDIFHGESEFLVVADLPGVVSDDLSVQVEDGELSVSARRRDGDGVTEITYRRAFRLPDTVDTTGIDAVLVDGVLTVHLPKRDEVKPRQIPIH